MPQYDYEAKTREGNSTSGRLKARSRRSAAGALRRQDLFVVRLAPGADASITSAVPRASPSEVAWQMWQLAMMLDTGLSLSDALGCLARQARRPALRALLDNVERRVREGQSMSAAMEAHPSVFPSSLTALVRASEMSGGFKDVLRKASQYLMSDLKMIRKFRGAMIYPAAMLAICAGVTVFLLTVILPKFAGVFAARNAPLPLPTRILMGLSEGILDHWTLLLCAVLGATYFAVAWSSSQGGKRVIDRLLITAPVASRLFNSLYQARTFTTLALMLDAHVPLLDAIR